MSAIVVLRSRAGALLQWLLSLVAPAKQSVLIGMTATTSGGQRGSRETRLLEVTGWIAVVEGRSALPTGHTMSALTVAPRRGIVVIVRRRRRDAASDEGETVPVENEEDDLPSGMTTLPVLTTLLPTTLVLIPLPIPHFNRPMPNSASSADGRSKSGDGGRTTGPLHRGTRNDIGDLSDEGRTCNWPER